MEVRLRVLRVLSFLCTCYVLTSHKLKVLGIVGKYIQTSKMAGEKFEPVMKVTAKEMADAKLPLAARDYCAHLLIPLLKCRKDTYYLPWKCHHEKHAWDRCQYDDYMYRVREKERRKLQQSAE